MNKEKLQSLFNNFLATAEKLEAKKAKYQKWYDNDWKKILDADIMCECAELENDLNHLLQNMLLDYGENKNESR